MSNVLINRFKTLPRLAARRFFVIAAVADFFGRRAFAREIEAVYSGMRKHHQGRDRGHDVFLFGGTFTCWRRVYRWCRVEIPSESTTSAS